MHRGLTAYDYTDEILSPPVKPHDDYHALADRAVFIHDGAIPHTSKVKQESLPNVTTGFLLWPAKCPDSITVKKVYSIILRHTKVINPLPKNAAELRTAHTLMSRSSHSCAHDDQWTALHTDFAPSSKIEVDMLIVIEWLNGFSKFSLFFS